MNIERSGMAVGPKATTGAESHGGKGKVKQNENPNSLAGGGFLALLASLESEAFAIVGDAPAMQARLITCIAPGIFESTTLFETVIAQLQNAFQPKRFIF